MRERDLQIPDEIVTAAARFGVVVIEGSAAALGAVLDAIRREIGWALGGLMGVLGALGTAVREGLEIEDWPEEVVSMAAQLGVTSAEDLQSAVAAEIATLEEMDRAVEAFGAEVADGEAGSE